ncbi:phage tail protein [Kitasatospora sp. NPDC094028]
MPDRAGPSSPLSRATAQRLQRVVGNRAVAAMVASRRAGPEAGPPGPARVTAQAAPAPSAAAPSAAALPVQRRAAGARAPAASSAKFQTVASDVRSKKKTLAAHPPPATAANAAQAAAKPPADDRIAQGKAANAEKMNAAQPGTFDKAAFVRAVNEAISAQAPKNLDEADKFSRSGKAAAVKGQVQGQVADGRKKSAAAIETTTKAAPDTSAAREKPVTPLAPQPAAANPGAPDASHAVPDKAPPAATDFSAGPKQVDQQMADAQVTEAQLAKSNEPAFTAALKDKKAGEQHAATAPGQVRAAEARTLTTAKAAAATAGATAMTGLTAIRQQTDTQVRQGQQDTRSGDEKKRADVTAKLQTVFDATKTEVEAILSGLDKKVDDAFTAGEKAARDAFTADHKHRMDEYKHKRYSGFTGKLKWVKDKFAGLPAEADQIFVVARQGYVTRMQSVISGVADVIAAELNRAKRRIATGRQQLQAEVRKLPADLQAIGKEAAGQFAGRFDTLTESVDAKGQELVQTLADKYNSALKEVDAEIEAEKEKNKGLIAKAVDAVKGVITTILHLKDLLLGVLAKAAHAVMAILKDPIGFLGHLVSAVGAGLRNFLANIGTHLKKGLIGWLLGTMSGAGLQLPAKFDLRGILTMIASLLGLTWGAIRGRIVAKGIPEQAMSAVESGVPMVAKLQSEGVAGVEEEIKEQVGDLKENLLGKISSYLIPTVLMAGITWIISLLNPASAFIKACKMIIDIITFIVERGAQIIEFVNAVLDSVIAIAGGGGGGVPGMIEGALAKSIPVLIGALAAILGIGGIANKVKSFFQALSKPVMKAVDWIVRKIVKLGKAIWAKLKAAGKKVKDRFGGKKGDGRKTPGKDAGPAKDLPLPSKPFSTRDGEQHRVLFTGRGASAELKVHSVEQRIADFFQSWATEVGKLPDSSPEKAQQSQALAAAKAKSDDVEKRKDALGRDGAASLQRQTDYDALVGDMTTLARLLAARSPKPPLPPPVLPPFSNGVLAGGFKAEFLPRNIRSIHPGEAAEKNKGATLTGWDYVALNGLNPPNTTVWVKMHLLPDPLGGKATDSNLVPALATTNTTFHYGVEDPAAQALGGGHEDMIWYEVDVKTHASPAGFLESITVRWAGYEVKDGAWHPKSANSALKQELSSASQPTPAGVNPLMLNAISPHGWKGLSNAIFGSKDESPFCNMIIGEKSNGDFTDDMSVLRLRLVGANSRRRSGSEIDGIQEKISKLVDAIQAGRIKI